MNIFISLLIALELLLFYFTFFRCTGEIFTHILIYFFYICSQQYFKSCKSEGIRDQLRYLHPAKA